MFLRVLFGGQDVIDSEGFEIEDEEQTTKIVMSVAQYLIYGLSKGKKWAP